MVKVSEYDSTKQPKPIQNGNKPVWDYVIEEYESSNVVNKNLLSCMRERKDFGFRKYGTYLQAGNGRNSREDLLQELLDAVVYAKQTCLENEGNIELEYVYDKILYILDLFWDVMEAERKSDNG